MLQVSIPCPDTATADTLARAALEARLAACADILPGVTRLYWWEGEIARDREVLRGLKTRQRHRAALTNPIEAAHPYDLPVLTWARVGATRAAQTWLSDATD